MFGSRRLRIFGQHEVLADNYLLVLPVQRLQELAETIGIAPKSLLQRAYEARKQAQETKEHQPRLTLFYKE